MVRRYHFDVDLGTSGSLPESMVTKGYDYVKWEDYHQRRLTNDTQ